MLVTTVKDEWRCDGEGQLPLGPRLGARRWEEEGGSFVEEVGERKCDEEHHDSCH